MNYQQLQYVVEIAKTGSILAASKNLFMGQPNLSKSIKELECELGITIFKRTSKGVLLTEEGNIFHEYAKSIVLQLSNLEEMYTTPRKIKSYSISVPRATYISNFIGDFFNKNSYNLSRIIYQETNPITTLNYVKSSIADIGIIRFNYLQNDYFMNLLIKSGLEFEIIRDYNMVLITSENHPFKKYDKVPFDELSSYVEIVQGDLKSIFPSENNDISIKHSQIQIEVFDRGSQFDFLHNIKGSYMWVSPFPPSALKKLNLIQKVCTSSSRYKDIAIYNKNSSSIHITKKIILELINSIPISLS